MSSTSSPSLSPFPSTNNESKSIPPHSPSSSSLSSLSSHDIVDDDVLFRPSPSPSPPSSLPLYSASHPLYHYITTHPDSKISHKDIPLDNSISSYHSLSVSPTLSLLSHLHSLLSSFALPPIVKFIISIFIPIFPYIIHSKESSSSSLSQSYYPHYVYHTLSHHVITSLSSSSSSSSSLHSFRTLPLLMIILIIPISIHTSIVLSSLSSLLLSSLSLSIFSLLSSLLLLSLSLSSLFLSLSLFLLLLQYYLSHHNHYIIPLSIILSEYENTTRDYLLSLSESIWRVKGYRTENIKGMIPWVVSRVGGGENVDGDNNHGMLMMRAKEVREVEREVKGVITEMRGMRERYYNFNNNNNDGLDDNMDKEDGNDNGFDHSNINIFSQYQKEKEILLRTLFTAPHHKMFGGGEMIVKMVIQYGMGMIYKDNHKDNNHIEDEMKIVNQNTNKPSILGIRSPSPSSSSLSSTSPSSPFPFLSSIDSLSSSLSPLIQSSLLNVQNILKKYHQLHDNIALIPMTNSQGNGNNNMSAISVSKKSEKIFSSSLSLLSERIRSLAFHIDYLSSLPSLPSPSTTLPSPLPSSSSLLILSLLSAEIKGVSLTIDKYVGQEKRKRGENEGDMKESEGEREERERRGREEDEERRRGRSRLKGNIPEEDDNDNDDNDPFSSSLRLPLLPLPTSSSLFPSLKTYEGDGSLPLPQDNDNDNDYDDDNDNEREWRRRRSERRRREDEGEGEGGEEKKEKKNISVFTMRDHMDMMRELQNVMKTLQNHREEKGKQNEKEGGKEETKESKSIESEN